MFSTRILMLAALPLLQAGPLHPQSPPPRWQLAAARDSFTINVRGQPVGFTVLNVERTPTGFRVTELTRIGDMVRQDTELLLDEQQRMQHVSQTGQMQGQAARIELHYAAKRVTGSASIPASGGPRAHDIDTVVPADVIDDNLLQTVIPTLPWKPDAKFTLPVFSAGRNLLADVTLTVLGTETLATPHGDAEAFRIEMRGLAAVVHFWVSTAAPRRVLKTSAVEAPFEMIRAH